MTLQRSYRTYAAAEKATGIPHTEFARAARHKVEGIRRNHVDIVKFLTWYFTDAAAQAQEQAKNLEDARLEKINQEIKREKMEVAKIEEETVDRAWIEENILGKMRDILHAMKDMPSRVAGRANPQDPTMAREAIQEDVKKLADRLEKEWYAEPKVKAAKKATKKAAKKTIKKKSGGQKKGE